MGIVRPFVEADVPRVADLHRRVFRVRPEASPALAAAYRRYFSEVFLADLWREDGIHSLVHEDRDAITGFLGVVPRRMSMNGASLLAAASSQFVADERGRADLAGARLLRAFFLGPQDLSVADEAKGTTRRLWESLGGHTAPVHSVGWTKALRPCALVGAYLAERPAFRGLARAAAPLAWAADALATRLPLRPLRHEAPALVAEEPTPEAVAEHFPALAARWTLRPDHDAHRLRWALVRASAAEPHGPAEGVLLRDRDGRPAGWYVHRPAPGRIDPLLALVATPRAVAGVLQHLFHRAFHRGAVAVEGRLDLHLQESLFDRHAVLHRRGTWVLVHARRPHVLSAFQRGDAQFSPLEGELCLRFVPPASA